MRNKIKQMMNKEEGFTLVELLAVIVILGLIVALAVPAIGNVIERATAGTETAEEALIIDAARLYEVDNGEIGSTGISVQDDLIDNGYLDPRGNASEFSGTVVREDGLLKYNPTP